jgi:hypothetical protein
MATMKRRTQASEGTRSKKTLNLRRETLRDLAPTSAGPRGGVSGSGVQKPGRSGYSAGTANTNQSTG